MTTMIGRDPRQLLRQLHTVAHVVLAIVAVMDQPATLALTEKMAHQDKMVALVNQELPTLDQPVMAVDESCAHAKLVHEVTMVHLAPRVQLGQQVAAQVFPALMVDLVTMAPEVTPDQLACQESLAKKAHEEITVALSRVARQLAILADLAQTALLVQMAALAKMGM